MSSLQLDDGQRTLLVTKLDSYEKLEVMRALRGTGRSMSRSELEAASRLSSDAVDDALPSLERSKLVEHDPVDHRIRVGAASADPCFAALMQTYDEDRAAVLAVLSSAVMQRLRNMAAQAFADAFVIRKKRGDDG
jgi:DNA-binding IclR family transcriptional regulator